MPIEPGLLNLNCHIKATLNEVLLLTDADGNAWDLTGYTARANAGGGPLDDGAIDITTTVTDEAGGEITLAIDEAVTATFDPTESPTNQPQWDLVIDDGTDVTKMLQGSFEIVRTQSDAS